MTTMTDDVTIPEAPDASVQQDPAPAGPTLAQAMATMKQIETEMNGVVFESKTEIRVIILTLIARTHALLIGERGVAKSMLVDELFKRIGLPDSQKFTLLFSKNTHLEEILGPVSLPGLETESWRHVTRGMLPEALVAFGDETFKSNSAVLNAKLGILNERKFKNDGVELRVPLWSFFGASNELPTEPELAPYRDRFGATLIPERIKTEAGFLAMLDGQIARTSGALAASPPTVISRPEVELLQEAMTQVDVPDALRKQIYAMVSEAEIKHSLIPSGRRIGEGIKLAMANAALDGRDKVRGDDLKFLQHTLWTDPEDARKAQEVVMEFAGGSGAEAQKLRLAFDPFSEVIAEISAEKKANGDKLSRESVAKLTDLHVNVKEVETQISKAIAKAESSGHDTDELKALLADVDTARRVIREDLFS